MHDNKFEDISNVTMAEIHVAINNTEKGFYNALKNKDIKGALELAKRYIELNKLLTKRSSYINKNGNKEESDDIQEQIGKEVERIMNSGHTK